MKNYKDSKEEIIDSYETEKSGNGIENEKLQMQMNYLVQLEYRKKGGAFERVLL